MFYSLIVLPIEYFEKVSIEKSQDEKLRHVQRVNRQLANCTDPDKVKRKVISHYVLA